MRAKLRTERVRDILLRRNISQNNLASRLSISSGYCSQLLAGTRYPSPRLRSRLQQELKEDFDALFEAIADAEANHERPIVA